MKDVAVEFGIAIVTGLALWVFTSGAEDARHETTQGLVGDLKQLNADVVKTITGEATKMVNMDAAVQASAAVVNAIKLGQGNAWELAMAQTENLAQFANDAAASGLRIEHMNKRLLDDLQDVKESIAKRIKAHELIPGGEVMMNHPHPVSVKVQQSLDESMAFKFKEDDGKGALKFTIGVVQEGLAAAVGKHPISTPPTLKILAPQGPSPKRL